MEGISSGMVSGGSSAIRVLLHEKTTRKNNMNNNEKRDQILFQDSDLVLKINFTGYHFFISDVQATLRLRDD